ncbi:MAG: PorT family protein [Sphingobacteriales bacterium JAD_PAG50586_3]|nr:MAG: PorT family protein [Sphingobacteriales bacterium JAD_PAG50586_3]
MRKLLLIVCFLMAYGSFAFGQYSFGVAAGVNYGGPIGNIEGEGKPIPGFIGGPTIKRWFGEKWRLSASILYSFRGAEYSQTSTNDSTVYVTINQQQVPVTTNYTSNIKGTLKLHYIDVPIVVSRLIGKHSSIDFGPQLSYIVAGSDKGNNDIVFVENGVFNQKVAYNNFKELNRMDYGLTLGGTYYTNIGLSVSVRASRGIRSLYRKGFFSSRGLPETGLYNTFVHLTAAYNFGSYAH